MNAGTVLEILHELCNITAIINGGIYINIFYNIVVPDATGVNCNVLSKSGGCDKVLYDMMSSLIWNPDTYEVVVVK